uniref:Myelin protein zero like 3 n=1 Tax=Cyprinodon variegatus TaxID=28743 RepID=A0A3Q2D3U7_CYPVA
MLRERRRKGGLTRNNTSFLALIVATSKQQSFCLTPFILKTFHVQMLNRLVECLSQVSGIHVTTPAEVHASKGDTVMLPCTFTSTSPPTSKMSVHWSYRPLTGGPPLVFFHFSSRAYYQESGQFAGRIKWRGAPARGDASLSLINATLNDNGTYICDVTNPPDVFGPNSETVLTVTPKGMIKSLYIGIKTSQVLPFVVLALKSTLFYSLQIIYLFYTLFVIKFPLTFSLVH